MCRTTQYAHTRTYSHAVALETSEDESDYENDHRSKKQRCVQGGEGPCSSETGVTSRASSGKRNRGGAAVNLAQSRPSTKSSAGKKTRGRKQKATAVKKIVVTKTRVAKEAVAKKDVKQSTTKALSKIKQ